jgi:hypothetical protein
MAILEAKVERVVSEAVQFSGYHAEFLTLISTSLKVTYCPQIKAFPHHMFPEPILNAVVPNSTTGWPLKSNICPKRQPTPLAPTAHQHALTKPLRTSPAVGNFRPPSTPGLDTCMCQIIPIVSPSHPTSSRAQPLPHVNTLTTEVRTISLAS